MGCRERLISVSPWRPERHRELRTLTLRGDSTILWMGATPGAEARWAVIGDLGIHHGLTSTLCVPRGEGRGVGWQESALRFTKG